MNLRVCVCVCKSSGCASTGRFYPPHEYTWGCSLNIQRLLNSAWLLTAGERACSLTWTPSTVVSTATCLKHRSHSKKWHGRDFFSDRSFLFHQDLNWPMHECITLLFSVWLPLPLYFSSLVSSPLCTPPLTGCSLSPSVSIQWMEHSFFIFSLVTCVPLSNLKWEQGCPPTLKLPVKKPPTTHDSHTMTRAHTLQVSALSGLSGRQEIRGLLLSLSLIKRCWTASDC